MRFRFSREMNGMFGTATPLLRVPDLFFSGVPKLHQFERQKKKRMVITMRDRSKNRRPLQRGRNLSIEAIQTVQTLKRANRSSSMQLEQVFDSSFRRLLKLDMLAVLRELLRQNECFLALKVFKDIRKEFWYKPQLVLYVDMIEVFARNGLFDEVEFLHSCLKTESKLLHDIEGFNALLELMMRFKLTGLLMECYDLMKALGCEPNRTSFRILINGLESIGKIDLSVTLRGEAQKYYGESLEFLKEEEAIMTGN